MNKTLIVVLLVVAMLLVGFFVIFGRNKITEVDMINQNNVVESAPNTIVIKSFSFQPSSLVIKAGTSVTWENQDPAGHDVKSDVFSSPILKTGEKFQFTFDTKGTFVYYCGIHPTMTGTIVVE